MAAASSNPYVDMLVAAGIAVADATDKVAKITEFLKAKGYDEGTINKELHIAVVRLAAVKQNSTEVIGTVVGFTELRDSNDYNKKVALDAYKQAADEAIAAGKVAIVAGKAVALDDRRYIDSANTMENPNYGKPLGTIMQRTILIMTEDNLLQSAWGNCSVEIGTKYKFLGSMSKKMNLSLTSQVPPIALGKVEPKALFDQVKAYAASAQEAFSLGDALKQPVKPATFVLVQGYIADAGESRNGGAHITLMGDDVQQGIKVFFRAPEMTDYVTNTPRGADVLVFGKVGLIQDKRDPKKAPDHIINGMGIVKAAETSVIEKASGHNEEMDALLFN
jgi:hypothetical protein